MASRGDVESGRLVYTCNCGWLDIGHATPTDSGGTIGVTGLWQQLKKDPPQNLTATAQRSGQSSRTSAPGSSLDSSALTLENGFIVTNRQRSGVKKLGVWIYSQGVTLYYLVRRGMSPDERKSVALSIFMDVSLHFEKMQSEALSNMVSSSGFSVEDLVSDLIGFYVGLGEISSAEVDQYCTRLTKEESLAIWDAAPQTGKTNKTFNPVYSSNTRVVDTRNRSQRIIAYLTEQAGGATFESGFTDPCAAQPRAFPKALLTIKPVEQGRLFRRMVTQSGGEFFPEW